MSSRSARSSRGTAGRPSLLWVPMPANSVHPATAHPPHPPSFFLLVARVRHAGNATGTRLTMRTAVWCDGEVYSEKHVPKPELIGSAMDVTTQGAMNAQAESSDAFTVGAIKGLNFSKSEAVKMAEIPHSAGGGGVAIAADNYQQGTFRAATYRG